MIWYLFQVGVGHGLLHLGELRRTWQRQMQMANGKIATGLRNGTEGRLQDCLALIERAKAPLGLDGAELFDHA